MAIVVVTPPEAGQGLISLADAKAHLRVDYDDDDVQIGSLILSASRTVEARVKRRYLPQALVWIREHWSSPMRLPVAPGGDSSNIAIGQVTYADLSGATQTLDPSLYWARPEGDTLAVVRRWFAVWPLLGDAAERVSIYFSIGANSAPSDNAMHACRLLVSHWYENRDAVVGVDNRDSSTPLPFGVEALLTFEDWS